MLDYIFIYLEMSGEEPMIRDNVNNFSDKDQEHDVHKSGKPNNQSQCGSSSYFETINNQLSEDLQFSNPYQNRGTDSTNDSYDLYDDMRFESKQAVVNVIKQFHYLYSFNYDVEENKEGEIKVNIDCDRCRSCIFQQC